MSALQRLVLLILSFSGGSFTHSALAAPDLHGRPNVLVLLTDQWRAQATGYAGDPNLSTPHLDALARGGANFVNAVAGVAVCSPMRASFLTGQRPLTHGVFINDVPLDPAATTIAKVFGSAGYDTGYIGKWHVNAQGRLSFIPRERRQGFDYWKVMECTHNYNQSYYYGDTPERLCWNGYDTIAQTADLNAYLRDRDSSDKPFLMVLAWGTPHDPYHTAPDDYRARFRAENITLRPNVPDAGAAEARATLAGYYAHCTALDDCVGEIVATLKATGQWENTIIVFTSDHGDLLGSHGDYFKQQPYDESVGVPFLVHWPRGLGPAGHEFAAPINSEDIMPTLLGLAGVKIPDTVEGLDYSGYLKGGADPSDGAALLACITPFGQWSRARGGREYRGIRTPHYTFVRDLSGPWLMFDRRADPFQRRNLVGDPAYAAVQAELDLSLQRRLAANGDAFLPGPDYIAQRGYEVDPKTGTVIYGP